jgi:hypothetical protein
MVSSLIPQSQVAKRREVLKVIRQSIDYIQTTRAQEWNFNLIIETPS